jgi:hypothetical protein
MCFGLQDFTSGTHFVDIAVALYQFYSLKMALGGPKHEAVTQYK